MSNLRIIKVFQYDGDLGNFAEDTNEFYYYIPDWAIKAHEQYRLVFKNDEYANRKDVAYIRSNNGIYCPLEEGDYVIMFEDNQDLKVIPADKFKSYIVENNLLIN